MMEKLIWWGVRLLAILTVSALSFVVLYIVWKGLPALSLDFLVKGWSHIDITKGGIRDAMLGTIYATIFTALFSIPLGIGTAIYLSEYATETRLVRLIRLCVRSLVGIPAIVYGLFGLAAFVYFLGLGKCVLSASLTLSIIVLPWVITGAEQALRSVPQEFRHASYALGATKWQTIRCVVFPCALPGVVTGAVLGLARVIGEAAPLLFTGAVFYKAVGFSLSPLESFMSLPYHGFILATQHASPLAKTYAAATATVLIGIVFLLISVATYLRFKYRVRW